MIYLNLKVLLREHFSVFSVYSQLRLIQDWTSKKTKVPSEIIFQKGFMVENGVLIDICCF